MLPKGLKVRTRTGFLDLSRKAENSLIVESAMLFGNSPDVRADAGQARRRRSPPAAARWRCRCRWRIPVDAITFVPLDGKQTAELELRVAAVDAGGQPGAGAGDPGGAHRHGAAEAGHLRPLRHRLEAARSCRTT